MYSYSSCRKLKCCSDICYSIVEVASLSREHVYWWYACPDADERAHVLARSSVFVNDVIVCLLRRIIGTETPIFERYEAWHVALWNLDWTKVRWRC